MDYVKHAVISFKRKNKLTKVNYCSLLKVCHNNECIVKSYSSGQFFLVAMGIWAKAQKSNSIYAKDDEGNVIIFIRDNLTDDKKLFALAHEIGHIILEHTEGTDEAEQEANNFAHYLLETNIVTDSTNIFKIVTPLIILLSAIIGLLCVDIHNLQTKNNQLSANNNGLCYFEKYGEAYHLYADCQYLKIK